MKKLKKFAALLLVGVMALALLTACGGGGSGEDAQAEASVMTAINGKRTAAKLDNDAERKAVASQNIDYVVKHGFGPFSSDVRFNVDTDHIKDGKFGFTFVAKYDYKDTKLDELIKKITNGNGTDIKSNHVDNWTNVGVVVKTVNGQTYIAVSVAIDVS
mgnify:FL=1